MKKLIVEKDVRLELLKHLALVDSTQKEDLVYLDSPFAKCRHHAFMSRCIARGDDCGPKAWLVT